MPNKRIAFIQKQCKNYPIYSAEGLLYGVTAIITSNSKIIKLLAEADGLQDCPDLWEEHQEVDRAFNDLSINYQLIKTTAAIILPHFSSEEDNPVYQGLCALPEAVTLHGIAQYLLSHVDPKFKEIYALDHTVEDVFAYQNQAPFAGGSSGEDRAEKSAEKAEKEAKKEERKSEKKAAKEEPAREKTVKAEAGEQDAVPNETVLEKLEILGKTFARLNYEYYVFDANMKRIKNYLCRKEVINDAELTTSILNDLLQIVMDCDPSRAYQNYQKSQSNENHAEYVRAQHKVSHKIFEYLEKMDEASKADSNQLLILSEKYSEIYDRLTQKVMGQDYAVNEFVQACFDAELYSTDEKHPQATFLFAGPPGVGKTFLASSVAELMERPFKVFDMSSYAIEKSDIQLIGVEPGFKNAMEGTLINFVEDNPDAILLFDEIEKAHPVVLKLFLSVLEGARLENKFLCSNTDFSHTILIFTTNAGKELYEDQGKNLSTIPMDLVIKELQKEKDAESGALKFPPELCSRFASQHMVMFNHVGISTMVKLIDRKIYETIEEISLMLNVSVKYDSRLALLLLMHSGKIDARVVSGQAQQFIRKELYELGRQMKRLPETTPLEEINFSIDDDRITEKVKEFFSREKDSCIVVACAEEGRKAFEELTDLRVIFVESPDDLAEIDWEDASAFFVDPYLKSEKVDDRILGLDDYRSAGLELIRCLLEKKLIAPVYLIEGERKVSPIDKNTFYMRGVEDTIDLTSDRFAEEMEEILENHSVQIKSDKLLKRRKIFDFETLQEAPDEKGVANIKFYDIVAKDSVNPEDQDLLIKIEERPTTSFDDVIGAENAKDELKDFVKYLENPKEYLKHALAAPKGVLLYGPPGTGKTMLARAMAGETDATFISVSAADLRSGNGTDTVKRLFDTARKYAPAIVFLDEVDAIAKKRTGGLLTSSWEESLLNMLLTQMDGFEQHESAPVFIIAATNFGVGSHSQMGLGLDPAFLRRFGNKILIDLPNKKERAAFLEKRLHRLGRKTIQNDVTQYGIDNIAERTQGQSLAELENILEQGFRSAGRLGQPLNDKILDEAMESYLYGEERKYDEEETYRTAIHEASHAYIYRLSGKKAAYMTVISRGDFGGYMQHEDSEGKGNMSKEELIWGIRTSLAGRVGEQTIFDDAAALNTGASSDLEHASNYAIVMLSVYGMCDGHLFTLPGGVVNPTAQTFAQPYEALNQSGLMPEYAKLAEEILEEEEKKCRELILAGKNKIVALAKALVDQGHLNQDEIEKILQD